MPQPPDLDTSLSYCTYCPKLCRHTCPVSNAEAKETLTPRDKMATMRLLSRAEVPRTVEQSEPLYGCTGCGACTDFCLHKVEPGQVLFRGRAEAERDGRAHPALHDFAARFAGRSTSAAKKTRAVVPEAKRPSEAQIAFFPGCDAPELAPTMLELCERIGAEYVGVADGEHGCAGYPLFAAGRFDAFRIHAERMARQLAGYARVVVNCPACVWAMRTQYKEYGVPLAPTIEHTSEFLEGYIERIPIGKKRAAAFYQDPCYLGRWLGVYEAPRRLAARAVDEVREFSRARNEAGCSGGGGLLPTTMPDAARAIADQRLGEVREARVSTVVTACPTCKRQLARDDVQAIDLVELLAEATKT
ncbi:MAG TPA: (Fe-S)-binding protein [Polyangia bacterium]